MLNLSKLVIFLALWVPMVDRVLGNSKGMLRKVQVLLVNRYLLSTALSVFQALIKGTRKQRSLETGMKEKDPYGFFQPCSCNTFFQTSITE